MTRVLWLQKAHATIFCVSSSCVDGTQSPIVADEELARHISAVDCREVTVSSTPARFLLKQQELLKTAETFLLQSRQDKMSHRDLSTPNRKLATSPICSLCGGVGRLAALVAVRLRKGPTVCLTVPGDLVAMLTLVVNMRPRSQELPLKLGSFLYSCGCAAWANTSANVVFLPF